MERIQTQYNFEQEDKCGSPGLPDLKNFYTVTVIKTVQDWHNERQIDQWKRKEKVEKETYLYKQMVFNKG